MIQKTYHIQDWTDEKGIQVFNEVASLDAYQTASDVLVLVLEESWERKQIEHTITLLGKYLPKAHVAGVSHYDSWTDIRGLCHNMIFSFLFLESSRCRVMRFDISKKSDLEAGSMVHEALLGEPDIKCVIPLFAKDKRDVGKILSKSLEGLEQVAAVGASAAVIALQTDMRTDPVNVSYVFDDKGCCEDTLLLVVLGGKQLHVRASFNFGWTPVGRTMTVTAMSDAYTVTEIDHQRAAEIYQKYLGIPYKTNRLSIPNICEFPLTVEHEGLRIPRIPYEWTKDGALRFGATVESGDRLQFSYGLPQQIFSQIEEDAVQFRAFMPQAILLVVCGNRLIFLRDKEHFETDLYRAVVPEAAFIHGNSEIYYNDGNGGEMHSALLALGLREGSLEEEMPRADKHSFPDAGFPDGDQVIPLELRLMTFLKEVTSDLEKTTDELLLLEQNLEDEVERKTKENESLSLHVVQTLAAAIDAKDTYTNGHSGRVAEYAREIAKRAGYSKSRQRQIYIMGLLHDVGKIGVPDAIINKPGKLTDEEFGQIKKHPGMGAGILSSITEMPELATGARWHHERFGGGGYPDGLKGKEIPEEARIIGVADAYDAMTSNRSYRDLMPQEKVRAQIEQGKGTQFDPFFAEIMLQMIDEDTEYRMRE